MTTLRLIQGGGGKPPPRYIHKKKKRPNPLVDLLWYAVSKVFYPSRATSVEEVARRMTRLSRRVLGYHVGVSEAMAEYCIYDNRRRKFLYGWATAHAQKGAMGYLRGYVPYLVDRTADATYYVYDDADAIFTGRGFVSSLRTIQSMLRNDAEIADVRAELTGEPRHRSFADHLAYSVEVIEGAVREAEAL